MSSADGQDRNHDQVYGIVDMLRQASDGRRSGKAERKRGRHTLEEDRGRDFFVNVKRFFSAQIAGRELHSEGRQYRNVLVHALDKTPFLSDAVYITGYSGFSVNFFQNQLEVKEMCNLSERENLLLGFAYMLNICRVHLNHLEQRLRDPYQVNNELDVLLDSSLDDIVADLHKQELDVLKQSKVHLIDGILSHDVGERTLRELFERNWDSAEDLVNVIKGKLRPKKAREFEKYLEELDIDEEEHTVFEVLKSMRINVNIKKCREEIGKEKGGLSKYISESAVQDKKQFKRKLEDAYQHHEEYFRKRLSPIIERSKLEFKRSLEDAIEKRSRRNEEADKSINWEHVTGEQFVKKFEDALKRNEGSMEDLKKQGMTAKDIQEYWAGVRIPRNRNITILAKALGSRLPSVIPRRIPTYGELVNGLWSGFCKIRGEIPLSQVLRNIEKIVTAVPKLLLLPKALCLIDKGYLHVRRARIGDKRLDFARQLSMKIGRFHSSRYRLDDFHDALGHSVVAWNRLNMKEDVFDENEGYLTRHYGELQDKVFTLLKPDMAKNMKDQFKMTVGEMSSRRKHPMQTSIIKKGEMGETDIALEVDASDTVVSIKQRNPEGKGVILRDNSALSDCRIKNGSTIDLEIKNEETGSNNVPSFTMTYAEISKDATQPVVVDGDSLLLDTISQIQKNKDQRNLNSTPLLDWAHGGQWLQAVCMVEQSLARLKRSGRNVVVVFFEILAQMWKRDDIKLLRECVKKHLLNEEKITGVPVICARDWINDPRWAAFVTKGTPEVIILTSPPAARVLDNKTRFHSERKGLKIKNCTKSKKQFKKNKLSFSVTIGALVSSKLEELYSSLVLCLWAGADLRCASISELRVDDHKIMAFTIKPKSVSHEDEFVFDDDRKGPLLASHSEMLYRMIMYDIEGDREAELSSFPFSKAKGNDDDDAKSQFHKSENIKCRKADGDSWSGLIFIARSLSRVPNSLQKMKWFRPLAKLFLVTSAMSHCLPVSMRAQKLQSKQGEREILEIILAFASSALKSVESGDCGGLNGLWLCDLIDGRLLHKIAFLHHVCPCDRNTIGLPKQVVSRIEEAVQITFGDESSLFPIRQLWESRPHCNIEGIVVQAEKAFPTGLPKNKASPNGAATIDQSITMSQAHLRPQYVHTALSARHCAMLKKVISQTQLKAMKMPQPCQGNVKSFGVKGKLKIPTPALKHQTFLGLNDESDYRESPAKNDRGAQRGISNYMRYLENSSKAINVRSTRITYHTPFDPMNDEDRTPMDSSRLRQEIFGDLPIFKPCEYEDLSPVQPSEKIEMLRTKIEQLKSDLKDEKKEKTVLVQRRIASGILSKVPIGRDNQGWKGLKMDRREKESLNRERKIIKTAEENLRLCNQGWLEKHFRLIDSLRMLAEVQNIVFEKSKKERRGTVTSDIVDTRVELFHQIELLVMSPWARLCIVQYRNFDDAVGPLIRAIRTLQFPSLLEHVEELFGKDLQERSKKVMESFADYSRFIEKDVGAHIDAAVLVSDFEQGQKKQMKFIKPTARDSNWSRNNMKARKLHVLVQRACKNFKDTSTFLKHLNMHLKKEIQAEVQTKPVAEGGRNGEKKKDEPRWRTHMSGVPPTADIGQINETTNSCKAFQLQFCGPLMRRQLRNKFDARSTQFGFWPDEWQAELLDIVDRRESAFVCAPTSAGKTFVAYYAMNQTILDNRTCRKCRPIRMDPAKCRHGRSCRAECMECCQVSNCTHQSKSSGEFTVVYVAPTLALLNQATIELYSRYRNQRGIAIGQYHRQFIQTTNNCDLRFCDIITTDPEGLERLLFSTYNDCQTFIKKIRYVVIDEIQYLAEDPMLERVLKLLKCPFLALSATVPNAKQLMAWIDRLRFKVETEDGEVKERKVNYISYPHRYADLRKSFYFPKMHNETAYARLQNNSEDDAQRCFIEVHPLAALELHDIEQGDSGQVLPRQALTMSPRECLQLYSALYSLEQLPIEIKKRLPGLDPEEYFRQKGFLSRIDVRDYESKLWDVVENLDRETLAHLVTSLRSSIPPDLFHEPCTRGRRKGSFVSLLADLRSANMLPAIVFNLSWRQCQDLIDQVCEELDLLGEEPPEVKILEEDIATLQGLIEDVEDAEAKGEKESLIRDSRADLKSVCKRYRMTLPTTTADDFLKNLRQATSSLEKMLGRKRKTFPKMYHFGMENTSTFNELLDKYLVRAEDRRRYTKRAGIDKKYVELLRLGIGYYDEAIDKDFRRLVVTLFRLKHIKVLIGGKDLSIGVNLPARTTVLCGNNNLEPILYRQMTGRAGRRGHDDYGNVVFYGIPTDFAFRLMRAPLPDIRGHSSASVGTVLRTVEILNALHAPVSLPLPPTTIKKKSKQKKTKKKSKQKNKKTKSKQKKTKQSIRDTWDIESVESKELVESKDQKGSGQSTIKPHSGKGLAKSEEMLQYLSEGSDQKRPLKNVNLSQAHVDETLLSQESNLVDKFFQDTGGPGDIFKYTLEDIVTLNSFHFRACLEFFHHQGLMDENGLSYGGKLTAHQTHRDEGMFNMFTLWNCGYLENLVKGYTFGVRNNTRCKKKRRDLIKALACCFYKVPLPKGTESEPCLQIDQKVLESLRIQESQAIKIFTKCLVDVSMKLKLAQREAKECEMRLPLSEMKTVQHPCAFENQPSKPTIVDYLLSPHFRVVAEARNPFYRLSGHDDLFLSLNEMLSTSNFPLNYSFLPIQMPTDSSFERLKLSPYVSQLNPKHFKHDWADFLKNLTFSMHSLYRDEKFEVYQKWRQRRPLTEIVQVVNELYMEFRRRAYSKRF